MEAAAEMASLAGRYEPAIALLQTVADARARAGRQSDAARLAGRIGRAMRYLGRGTEAIDRLQAALDVLGADDLDPDVAEVNLQLGTALTFAGRVDDATPALERALIAAEALELPAVLCGALTSTAVTYAFRQRHEQERGLLQIAIELAERHGVSHESTRARSNLGESLLLRDSPGCAEAIGAALDSARRLGDRGFESIAAGNLMYRYLLTGAWDEIDRLGATLLAAGGAERSESLYVHHRLVLLALARGDVPSAHAHLEQLAPWCDTEDIEDQALYAAASACIAMAGDDLAGGLDRALAAIGRVAGVLGTGHESVRHAWPAAVEGALVLGRLDDVDALIAHVEGRPPGHVPPFMRAQLALARGRRDVARGSQDAGEADLRAAVDGFARLGYPFWLARAQTELAASLLERGRQDEAGGLVEEATTGLEALGAAPALARARELSTPLVTLE
jgi:tetratricopeptide (TPR) repeat protein